MTFNKAVEMMKSFNTEEFYNQYDYDQKYVLMGCIGRFMRKADWDEHTFFVGKDQLVSPKSPIKRHDLVLWNRTPDLLYLGKLPYDEEGDWIIEDRLPAETVVLKYGEKGIWGNK